MPQVAKYSGTSAELVAQACRVVLAVTFFLGILIMVASIYLVPLVVGKEFSPIHPLMWKIFPGIVLQSICKILYHFFQGINRPMTVSSIYFISLATMITVDILLIPIIGITGAAVGTLIAAFLEAGMFSGAFIRETKLRWYSLFVLNSSDWKYMHKKCFRKA
jgi:O-antigen/teichoic acid export membrane protein